MTHPSNMSAAETVGILLGAVPLPMEALRIYTSSIQTLKRYKGSSKDIQKVEDALINFEQSKQELECFMPLISSDGNLILSDEERQLAERFIGRSMTFAIIVAQRLENFNELKQKEGHGTLRLKKRSRKALNELAVEVTKMTTELRGDFYVLNARMQRVTTVEYDALPFQQILSDSGVYRKSNSVPSGLAPVQFADIFPDATLPDQDYHQEDPEDGKEEADTADWPTAEFYSDEKQEEAETTVDDSSSIVSLTAGAWSTTTSYEDRLPHRSNDRYQKTVYDVFIYDERGHPHKAECLLDTGASLDCISLQMARRLRLKTRLKRLRTPVEFRIGSGELLAASYVVESFWAFVNKPKDCYERPLYVLEGFPHDMALSEQTIFQEDFLLANLEISPSFGISTTQEGFERMLPLGLPKQKKVVRVTQDQAAEEAGEKNEEQRQSDFAEFKLQAAEKKRKAAEKKKKEGQGDGDTQ